MEMLRDEVRVSNSNTFKYRVHHVTQVGTVPPPTGGVSIHILRLIRALHERGIESELIDLHWFPGKSYDPAICGGSRCGRLLAVLSYWMRIVCCRGILHYHASSLRSFMIMNGILLAGWRRARIVVTLHTGESLPSRHSTAYRLVTRLLRQIDGAICVSEELHQRVSEAMGDLRSPVLARISPYIASRDPTHPAASRKRSANPEGKRILVSGYGIAIYNWEFVREMVDVLSSEIEWICCVYGDRDPEYWPVMEQELKSRKNITLHCDLDCEDFANLLKTATVYFRPTHTDGDSVTIHEALAHFIPCVASSVVKRPAGVMCYGHNSRGDCRDQLMAAIRFAGCEDQRIVDHEGSFPVNSVDDVLDLYNRIAVGATRSASESGGIESRF